MSRLVMLPKKGDFHDPNNWIGVNLLDVGSKVLSVILNMRAQKILKSNGHTIKFGVTPGVGCV